MQQSVASTAATTTETAGGFSQRFICLSASGWGMGGEGSRGVIGPGRRVSMGGGYAQNLKSYVLPVSWYDLKNFTK